MHTSLTPIYFVATSGKAVQVVGTDQVACKSFQSVIQPHSRVWWMSNGDQRRMLEDAEESHGTQPSMRR